MLRLDLENQNHFGLEKHDRLPFLFWLQKSLCKNIQWCDTYKCWNASQNAATCLAAYNFTPIAPSSNTISQVLYFFKRANMVGLCPVHPQT